MSYSVGSLIKGSAALLISNISLKAISFFLLPLYTSYLTTTDYGIIDMILNFTSLLYVVLTLCLDSAFCAFYFDKKTPLYQSKIFNTQYFVFVLTGLAATIGIIFSKQISFVLLGTDIYYQAVGIALLSTSANLWLYTFVLNMRMHNQYTKIAIISLVTSVLQIVANIIMVVVLKLGFYSMIVSALLNNVLQLIVYWFFNTEKIRVKSFDKKLLKSMMKYALPLLPYAIVMWAMTYIDRYMIQYFNGTAQVGIYGIAARIVVLVAIVSGAFISAFITYAFGNRDTPDIKEKLVKIANIFFVVLGFIALAVGIFAYDVVHLLTANPEFHSAYTMVAFLLFGNVAYGMTSIVGVGISFKK
ncbi:MAG: oligosaccharide flippase family protein, partial [Oscillospiraceae bacterium]